MFKRKALLETVAGEMIAVATASGEPVARVQLLPIGPITSKRDNRKWRVRDLAHAQAIVEATVATASPAEIPIDYDHQLVNAPGVGGTAKAAGWMRNFKAEPTGIYADVEWTAAAEAALRAREYRYISPVFAFDRASGDISRIFNAGLTNYPAITELAEVASAETGTDMDLTALAAALGLAATATLEECVAAATAARTAAASQLTLLATAAGVPAAATVEAVSAAIAQAKSGAVDPTKYAPISELAAANARLLALETESKTKAAAAAVDAAIASGKVTPGNRPWAESYAAKDLEGFNAFVASAPVVAAASVIKTENLKLESVSDLAEDELAVCSAMRITPEAYLKSKKELTANGRA